jgi:hypothetical protein
LGNRVASSLRSKSGIGISGLANLGAKLGGYVPQGIGGVNARKGGWALHQTNST